MSVLSMWHCSVLRVIIDDRLSRVVRSVVPTFLSLSLDSHLVHRSLWLWLTVGRGSLDACCCVVVPFGREAMFVFVRVVTARRQPGTVFLHALSPAKINNEIVENSRIQEEVEYFLIDMAVWNDMSLDENENVNKIQRQQILHVVLAGGAMCTAFPT